MVGRLPIMKSLTYFVIDTLYFLYNEKAICKLYTLVMTWKSMQRIDRVYAGTQHDTCLSFPDSY